MGSRHAGAFLLALRLAKKNANELFQVMLANPVGALAFAAVLYIFFSSRIRGASGILALSRFSR